MPQSRSVNHLRIIGKKDDWETPANLLIKACNEFDIWPVLDVCATQHNKKCTAYYSKLNDGLVRNWDMDFFMNPPYSMVEKWMQKAYDEYKLHNVSGLILTYNKTDTKWWHDYVENRAEIHFIKGRIKFEFNGIPSANSSPYPSVWIIYRREK